MNTRLQNNKSTTPGSSPKNITSHQNYRAQDKSQAAADHTISTSIQKMFI